MVLDVIENLSEYQNICHGAAEAAAFCKSNNLSGLAEGRYGLGGGYVVIQSYETANKKPILEAHKKYIDIQYMISGSEAILWQNIQNGVKSAAAKDGEDCFFYEAGGCAEILLTSGMFCIFYPEDLHCPGLTGAEQSKVKKAVFKIPVR